jgi:hypothetical protein
MQTPPPFREAPNYNPGVPKKSNTGLIIGIVVGVLVLCCGLPTIGSMLLFGKVKDGIGGLAACASNSETLSNALKSYAAANDGKIPPAASWKQDLSKYMVANSKEMEGMEVLGAKAWGPNDDWTCKEGDVSTRWVMDPKFGGKLLKDAGTSEVILFESAAVKGQLIATYKPEDFKTSPKVMGIENRGFYVITSGGLNTVGKSGSLTSGADFNSGKPRGRRASEADAPEAPETPVNGETSGSDF